MVMTSLDSGAAAVACQRSVIDTLPDDATDWRFDHVRCDEVTLVIEGAPAGAETVVDVEAEVRRRVDAGESPKEIAAAVALLTGKPRRMIYQLALSLRPR